jgi:hypothetical protein
VLGIRYDNWKLLFQEQRCPGTLQVWAEFAATRVPKMFNLRTDPYERADITSNTYWDWMLDRAFMAIYGQALVSQFLETFKEFPPQPDCGSTAPLPRRGIMGGPCCTPRSPRQRRREDHPPRPAPPLRADENRDVNRPKPSVDTCRPQSPT